MCMFLRYTGAYTERAGRIQRCSHTTIRTGICLKAYAAVKYGTSNSTDGTPHTSYWQVGLMGETVWVLLLQDLYAEGYTTEASHMESLMKARQDLWAGLPDPFGSEMAWDSTGEEGVYLWSQYFNDMPTAMKSINAIRGYMPTVAHWGWNGNARRYWVSALHPIRFRAMISMIS